MARRVRLSIFSLFFAAIGAACTQGGASPSSPSSSLADGGGGTNRDAGVPLGFEDLGKTCTSGCSTDDGRKCTSQRDECAGNHLCLRDIGRADHLDYCTI